MRLTANGIQTAAVQIGRRHLLSVSGSAAAFGTLRLWWLDSGGNPVPFEQAALSGPGGFAFTSPTSTVLVELTNATSPDLRVSLQPQASSLAFDGETANPGNPVVPTPVYGSELNLTIVSQQPAYLFGGQTIKVLQLRANVVSGDPLGNRNRYMLLRFSSNLVTWLPITGPEQGPGGYSGAWLTGPTGEFEVTITAVGDFRSAWDRSLFFRGRYRLG